MFRSIVTRVVCGLLIAFGMFALASVSLATVINVDFNTSTSPTYSGAGVYSDPGSGTLWNSVVGPAWQSTSPTVGTQLKTSLNVSTGVGVKVEAQNGFNTGTLSGTGPTIAPNLMQDYIVVDNGADESSSTANPAAKLTISGLISGNTYDLYLYALDGFTNGVNGNGRSDTNFSFGGSVIRAYTPLATSSAFVQATSANPLGNYCVFSGLTADSLGQIAGDMYTWNAYQGALDGLQIVGTFATTPEPGTLVLLVSGLIGLACYAWRKRK